MEAIACRLCAFSENDRREYDTLRSQIAESVVGVGETTTHTIFQLKDRTRCLSILAAWMEMERRCCPFLSFNVEIPAEGDELWLGLSGPTGTREFVRMTFQDWIKAS